MKNRIYKINNLMLFILIIIAFRTFYLSLNTALNSSIDMQWYPTLQLWGLGDFSKFTNPYLAYISGDRFLSNGPNYMPLLYFLMFPFALLNWENAKLVFGIFNIICFILSAFLIYKNSQNKILFYFLTILTLVGYAFPNVVGNAQTATIIGLFICIAYYFRNKPIVLIIALSVISVKHSFGVPILLGFFLAGFKKEVIYSCFFSFFFVCLFAFILDSNPISILQSISQVNSMYTSPNSLGGPSDLFSLSQKLYKTPYSIILFFNIAIYLSFVFLIFKFRPSINLIIASSILLSLFSLPHLGYDSYMLFIAMALISEGLKPNNYAFIALIFCSAFLWRGEILKKYIDSLSNKIITAWGGEINNNTFWSMDMGVPFCILICIVLIVIFYSLLIRKEISEK